jgi:hypothetical protein
MAAIAKEDNTPALAFLGKAMGLTSGKVYDALRQSIQTELDFVLGRIQWESYEHDVMAGLDAEKRERLDEAIGDFESARRFAPLHHDVLSNLAIMMTRTGNNARAIELSRRLGEQEPYFEDGFQILTVAYANVARSFQSASAQHPDSQMLRDSASVYTDSALKYNALKAQLPATITWKSFSHSVQNGGVEGTLTNRTAHDTTVAMTLEFLDASGAVVARSPISVGPVGPGSSAPFNVTVSGSGIRAFRYRP